MDRKKIKTATLFVVVAAVTLCTLLFVLYLQGKGREDTPVLSGISKVWKSVTSAPAPLPTNDPFSDKIVNQLQRFYGRTIADKSVQASILAIRDFVLGLHPENGKNYFYGILMRAFPEYADEIMETLNKLDQYNLWLAENKDRLVKMTASNRLAAMWEKRKDLFGKDAEKIWSGELLASEARQAKVQDTLAELSQARDMSIDRKLDVYRRTLREAYDGTPESFVLNQGSLLSKVFFSIDSVQEDLNNMSPEQRQQEINRLRAQMGFTEREVESMAKRDADNAGRWDAGLKYMEKRETVVQQYEGQEREDRLKALRNEYFGDEANTIALEEKDDFYRFKRPHIWGRN